MYLSYRYMKLFAGPDAVLPNVLIANIPALDNNCKLMCNWGGVISFVTPGQFTHQIP